MAEFILKLKDSVEGIEIEAFSDPAKLDPFSAVHQFAFALQQNQDLLSNFIQSAIDSIKAESLPRIITGETTE